MIFDSVVPSVISYDSVCGGDTGGAEDTGTISSSHYCFSSTGVGGNTGAIISSPSCLSF